MNKCCNNDCNQGRNCPNRKTYHLMDAFNKLNLGFGLKEKKGEKEARGKLDQLKNGSDNFDFFFFFFFLKRIKREQLKRRVKLLCC